MRWVISQLYLIVMPLLARINCLRVEGAISFLFLGLTCGASSRVARCADQRIKAQHQHVTTSNIALQLEAVVRRDAQTQPIKTQEELDHLVDERTRSLRKERREFERMGDICRRQREQLARMGSTLTIGEIATTMAHEINHPLSVISGNAIPCLSQRNNDEAQSAGLPTHVEHLLEQAKRAQQIILRVRGFMAKRRGTNATTAECGSADRRLTIRTTKDRSGVGIAVRDNGCGIPASDIGSLLDPLFTTKRNGLGLGLSISRTTIEAQDGRSWEASEMETWNKVRFRLPTSEQTRHVER